MLKIFSANLGIWVSNIHLGVTERSANPMERLLESPQRQNRHVPCTLFKSGHHLQYPRVEENWPIRISG